MDFKEARLIHAISLTGATRRDLLVPMPEEPLDIAMLRKATWAFEQLDPEYQARLGYLDLRGRFGENLYPSGVTILSDRPETVLVGLRLDADDFHDKTFVWEGVTFDPFYHLIEAGEDKKEEEMLIINWRRNNPEDKSALSWRVTLCNLQSVIEGEASADTIFITAQNGQILLSLSPGVEGATSSYFLEISNLRHPIRKSWLRK